MGRWSSSSFRLCKLCAPSRMEQFCILLYHISEHCNVTSFLPGNSSALLIICWNNSLFGRPSSRAGWAPADLSSFSRSSENFWSSFQRRIDMLQQITFIRLYVAANSSSFLPARPCLNWTELGDDSSEKKEECRHVRWSNHLGRLRRLKMCNWKRYLYSHSVTCESSYSVYISLKPKMDESKVYLVETNICAPNVILLDD